MSAPPHAGTRENTPTRGRRTRKSASPLFCHPLCAAHGARRRRVVRGAPAAPLPARSSLSAGVRPAPACPGTPPGSGGAPSDTALAHSAVAPRAPRGAQEKERTEMLRVGPSSNFGIESLEEGLQSQILQRCIRSKQKVLLIETCVTGAIFKNTRARADASGHCHSARRARAASCGVRGHGLVVPGDVERRRRRRRG